MRLGRLGALLAGCLRLEFAADSAWGTLCFKLPSVEICHLYYFVGQWFRSAVALVEVGPVLLFIGHWTRSDGGPGSPHNKLIN